MIGTPGEPVSASEEVREVTLTDFNEYRQSGGDSIDMLAHFDR